MKVQVINTTGSLSELITGMKFEGDTVVESHAPTPPPDDVSLIITDKQLPSPPLPTITFNESLPRIVLEALGFEITDPSNPQQGLFTVTRWHNSSNQYHPQVIVGIPLLGLMNNDLSKQIVTGYALHPANTSSLGDLFLNPKLLEILAEWKHVGFITFTLALDPDSTNPFSVLSLSTGIPFKGILPIMEGRKAKISTFFLEEQSLLESWSVSIRITRFPFPHRDTHDRVFFRPPNGESLRHFWHSTIVFSTAKACYTDHTSLGYSTAYSRSLTEANRRALRTCRELRCPEKQYRTDLSTSTMKLWSALKTLHLVSQAPLQSAHVSASPSNHKEDIQTSQSDPDIVHANPNDNPPATSLQQT